MILKKAYAFIKRDFQIETSYTINFLITAANSVFPLILFFFIGKLVNPAAAELERYGGNYFAFSLIGLAFARYFQLALSSFSESIQRAQLTGCLEAMFGSQTPPQVCVLLSSLYSLITSAVQLFIIFGAGIVVFHFDLSNMNLLSAFVVFALSLLIFLCFGLISASGIIVLKKGDPLGWLLTSSNFILGGAFFPTAVMPEWLEKISLFVPARYSLDALRLTMLRGYSLSGVSEQVFILGMVTLILLPLSIRLFLLSVEKAKKDGSLAYY
jgi:ABC-2 type transport system permease protein